MYRMEEIDPEVNRILSTFPKVPQNMEDNRIGVAKHIPSGLVVWVHYITNNYASIELAHNGEVNTVIVELSDLEFNSI